MTEKIIVEVVYATPEQQTLLELNVDKGSDVEAVILKSVVLTEFPEIDLKKNKVGIFGKITKLSQVVREKDRIEIYRALIADPKEVRKKRAAEGKALKKGGGDVTAEAKE